MNTLRAITTLAVLALLCLNAAAGNRTAAGTQPANNPWFLQGELTGSDSPYDLGYSTSVSGNTIVSIGNGAAYVFVKSGGRWNTAAQTAKLTSSDGTFFDAVAISGNTIVAADFTANNYTGEAYVFVEPSGGWTNMTETAILTASDGVAGTAFGKSVAIAGNTVVVGAYENNSVGISYPVGAGAAYVFTKPASGWSASTETAKLTSSDGVPGDDLGYTVAVAGNTIVAGAPDATVSGNQYEGALYVYQKTGSTWTSRTETAKLTASNGEFVTVLGYSLSISGTTIAGGAIDQVYIFNEPSGGWVTGTQNAELQDPSGYTFIQDATAICNQYVLAGMPETTNHPLVDLYVRPSAGWANEGPAYRFKIPADNGARRFGTSVGVVGTTLVIGSPFNGLSGGGIIYVYGPA